MTWTVGGIGPGHELEVKTPRADTPNSSRFQRLSRTTCRGGYSDTELASQPDRHRIDIGSTPGA